MAKALKRRSWTRADEKELRRKLVQQALDAFLVGRASMMLGAGRDKASDEIDPGVGITVHAKPGDRVGAGDPVLELRYRTERGLADAARMAASAITIGDTLPDSSPLIIDEII